MITAHPKDNGLVAKSPELAKLQDDEREKTIRNRFDPCHSNSDQGSAYIRLCIFFNSSLRSKFEKEM